MDILEINKDVTSWLVELAGDGSHDSFIVKGSLADVKCALVVAEADEFSPDLTAKDSTILKLKELTLRLDDYTKHTHNCSVGIGLCDCGLKGLRATLKELGL